MGQVQATFATAQRLEKVSGMTVIGSVGEMLTRRQEDERKRRAKSRARPPRWGSPMSAFWASR
ncbi:hypothetical protein AB5I41_15920 [Sphingomonas sp. MMS24-JH45]